MAAISAQLRIGHDPVLEKAHYLLLQAQDKKLREAAAGTGPMRYGYCQCGCGREVIGSRMGPARRYATAGCRQRAYRWRKRQQQKAAPGQVTGRG
jgi:hypothetical protein